MWTLQAKSDTQAAACNVYALTLIVDPQLTLTEGDAHLLLRAKLPPHAVSLIGHAVSLVGRSRVLRSAVQAGCRMPCRERQMQGTELLGESGAVRMLMQHEKHPQESVPLRWWCLLRRTLWPWQWTL